MLEKETNKTIINKIKAVKHPGFIKKLFYLLGTRWITYLEFFQRLPKVHPGSIPRTNQRPRGRVKIMV